MRGSSRFLKSHHHHHPKKTCPKGTYPQEDSLTASQTDKAHLKKHCPSRISSGVRGSSLAANAKQRMRNVLLGVPGRIR